MSADPNKKSARTFQCRDVLWETFEQMARELECSIDYLINESMKQYARQRSYSPRTPFPGNVNRDGAAGSGQHPMQLNQSGQSPAAQPMAMGGPAAAAPMLGIKEKVLFWTATVTPCDKSGRFDPGAMKLAFAPK